MFLLGLVYAGVKKDYMGENYTFIASGAVDDFMPVLHAFYCFSSTKGLSGPFLLGPAALWHRDSTAKIITKVAYAYLEC